MAAVIQQSMLKVKNKLNPYLNNNRISPVFDLVEQKVHLDRSLIALGMLLSFLFAHLIVLFT